MTISEPGECHHLGQFAALQLLELLNQLEAVHVRQGEILKDQIDVTFSQ